MLYYIVESSSSRRYMRWIVKRKSDGAEMSRHDYWEQAKARVAELTAAAAPENPLPELVITPNPARRA